MKTLKNKILQTIGATLLYLTTILVPIKAFALIGDTTGNTGTAPITTVQGLLNILCDVFGWMFYALIAVSIIVVVLGGFNYVTANGDAEKVSKANKMILYAAIGIAIAILAKGIPLIVGDFLGANGLGLTTC